MCPSIFQLPSLSIFQLAGGAGNLLHHQINSESQSIGEIQEQGETYPNSSALPEEVDGCKGQLLVPKLQFLMESIQRKEVHSGSVSVTVLLVRFCFPF